MSSLSMGLCECCSDVPVHQTAVSVSVTAAANRLTEWKT